LRNIENIGTDTARKYMRGTRSTEKRAVKKDVRVIGNIEKHTVPKDERVIENIGKHIVRKDVRATGNIVYRIHVGNSVSIDGSQRPYRRLCLRVLSVDS